ncbi:23S rRNA (guanosine(2251)-2'-O)-methyltransferase RlmB [Limnochorda pilosa]|uniref:RNA methyltransferase n=1 Tax=Limnochorda pilosa TaxID=1555112 RepID=A0A0K2SPP5_LIMPI|nr:23S rRNA (guanosine(2251)-2'-O)-methyltransferase RlmB [Limnochorda pilosa]BAS29108.1 RNA methyltransferase [Limnochorda pilosa]
MEGRQAVLELLRSGRPVERLLVARDRRGTAVGSLLKAAEERHLRVEEVDVTELARLSQTGRHQGVIAFGQPQPKQELEAWVAAQAGRKEVLLLACDQVQDPHNLGALARSAEAAGAAGMVVPARRSAGLTATVERAAAGATSYLPWVEVVNLARALERLQQAGFWVLGLDAQGERSLWEVDLPRRLVAVVGAEGSGLRPLVRSRCDELVRIPMRGHVGSLNVSVAGALFLFEVLRRRTTQSWDEDSSRRRGGGA